MRGWVWAVGLSTGGLVVAAVSLESCGRGSVSTPRQEPAAVCGNGRVETGEECDDGNAANGDGCYTTCLRPVTWVPSDPHIHSTGCGAFFTPDDVARELRNQSIKVGSVLVWGDGFDDDAPFFTGRDHPLSRPDFLLHYDMEISAFAAGNAGHLLLLGLDSLAFSGDLDNTPRSGVPILEWARRQPRVVAGMAHGQFWSGSDRFPRPPTICCTPWEYAAHVARGRLDFVSLERLPQDEAPVDAATFQMWRTAQNSGFRVAIAGASDWPCITHPFSERTPRTDVIVEGELTYERWLEALKAGRTAAAIGIGNRLNLRVNGVRIGDELRLAAPAEVTVTLESIEPFPFDAEVLVNGDAAARVRVEGGAQVVQVRLPLARSSWVSAKSPRILTSPVYVLVGDRPIRASAADTCYLMRWVDYVSDLVTSRRLDLRESQAEALQAYDEAHAELQRRFTEAGGLSCQ